MAHPKIPRSDQAAPWLSLPSTATERTALLQKADNRRDKFSHTHLQSEDEEALNDGPGTSQDHRWSNSRSPSVSTTSTLAPDDAGGTHDSSPLAAMSRSRTTALALAFVTFLLLQAINVTLMTTTQGQICGDLEAYDYVSWFTSVYLIGMSSMSPVFGRMSQVFSIHSCVLAATLFFACGALIASQARRLAVFLLGRTIQGIGAAGALSLCVIFIIQLAPLQRRGLLVGTANSAVTIGVSVGAVLGGAFGESLGWRTLMYLQSPFALAAGALVFLSLRGVEGNMTSKRDGLDEVLEGDESCEQSVRGLRKRSPSPSSQISVNHQSSERPQKEQRETTSEKLWSFDYAGSILLVAGISTLLVALAAPSSRSLVLGAIAIGLLTLFVLNEIYRASSPVVPVAILGSRGVLLSCLAQVALMTARVSVLLYAPIFTQAVLLWPATEAGAILLPTNGGFALGGLVVGQLHIRRAGSFYTPVLVCCLLFSLSILGLGLVATASCPGWLLSLLLFALGASTGAALNYFLAHVLHLSLPENHPVATSLLETFRGFSGSLGSAAGGGLVKAVLRTGLERRFREHGMLVASSLLPGDGSGGIQSGSDANVTSYATPNDTPTQRLIQKLLGQPELVAKLTGTQQEIARAGYEEAIRALFLSAAALALLTVFIQAGTGWRGPHERRSAVTDEDEYEDGAGDVDVIKQGNAQARVRGG